MGRNALVPFNPRAFSTLKPIRDWDLVEVSQFIKSLGSDDRWVDYASHFVKEEIDGEYLTEIDDTDLQEMVNKADHRKKILNEIAKRLATQVDTSSSDTNSDDDDNDGQTV